jgi:hypothetical protein
MAGRPLGAGSRQLWQGRSGTLRATLESAVEEVFQAIRFRNVGTGIVRVFTRCVCLCGLVGVLHLTCPFFTYPARCIAG